MSIAEAIVKMHQAGFVMAANGDALSVSPANRLTDTQRQFIRENKPAILAALRSPGAVLDACQPGNDLPPANDDRVTVHVPELVLSDGSKISFDLDVPAKNLPKLRHSLRFTLKDNGGGGPLLGEPGKSEADREVRLQAGDHQRQAGTTHLRGPRAVRFRPLAGSPSRQAGRDFRRFTNEDKNGSNNEHFVD
jgi:hypothetical protein